MGPPVNLVVLLETQPSRKRACCCMSLHHPQAPHLSAMLLYLEEAALETIRCVYHWARFHHLVTNQCKLTSITWNWNYRHVVTIVVFMIHDGGDVYILLVEISVT